MRGEPRIYGSARRQRPARPPRRRRRSCGHLHGCVGCVFVDAGLARHRASSARPMRGEPRIYGFCSAATTRTSTTPSPTLMRASAWLRRLPARRCRACPAPGFIGKAHAGPAPHLPDLLGGNDPHVNHAVVDSHAGICMVASAACSSMPGLPGTGLHRQGRCGASPASYGVCSAATTRTSTTPSPTRARSASPSRSCAVERTSAPSSARVRIA